MVVVEGPDGAPAETTHPDGCERGGDHSKPSSSTAFERTRKSSASIPALAALGAGKPEGAGSVTEPDSSSASEATSDMLSSASSSLLPPNETRSLMLAEGRWSGWEKRTGDTSLCGESEAYIKRFILKRQTDRGSAYNTKSQTLFK